jgi:Protein of unknown function (DUF3551)
VHFEKTSFFVALVTPTVSQPTAGKYCVQGPNMGYPGDCSYSTYAQCPASASGTMDGCGTNRDTPMHDSAAIPIAGRAAIE